jgi:hypothetical protein
VNATKTDEANRRASPPFIPLESSVGHTHLIPALGEKNSNKQQTEKPSIQSGGGGRSNFKKIN